MCCFVAWKFLMTGAGICYNYYWLYFGKASQHHCFHNCVLEKRSWLAVSQDLQPLNTLSVCMHINFLQFNFQAQYLLLRAEHDIRRERIHASFSSVSHNILYFVTVLVDLVHFRCIRHQLLINRIEFKGVHMQHPEDTMSGKDFLNYIVGNNLIAQTIFGLHDITEGQVCR